MSYFLLALETPIFQFGITNGWNYILELVLLSCRSKDVVIDPP